MHEDLFGDTASHEDGELRFEVLLVIAVLIVNRKLHRQTESHSARNDGDLVQWVGKRRKRRYQSVAGLMIRRVALFFFANDEALAFDPHHYLVFG